MFHIRKLDIFIIKQFGMLFIGTFVVSLFVLMMQFLWQYVDELIGKGLTLDVLGEFFWYMSLMMVPEALPLAVLLSSLITFGNLGESSELTAIKAAGISLIKSFRGVIAFTLFIALISFYFQNSIGPDAKKHFDQLLISMKQKSPELEIPEGIFYNGIPDTNLYVEKRDLKTGHLYNIMIYRMTDSYEDQAIILADSGMLQSTAEKKHLILNLWNGEWFENMRSQELSSSASVPYRRESFVHKKLIIDFNEDFNLTSMAGIADDARTKSIAKIHHDKDSLIHVYDSVGNVYYRDAQQSIYPILKLKKKDMNKAIMLASTKNYNLDSIYTKLRPEERSQIIERTLMNTQQTISDLDFKSMITSDGDKLIRMHDIAEINKYLLALTCLIFFFIGAPLGAIIRKGGLGVPIIISVLVFIIYYILNNTGYRMARQGDWAIWFGRGLSPAILIPTAIFITYKANNDSAVFNIDLYRNFFIRILGLRMKRNISSKEVIISAPRYIDDADMLRKMNNEIEAYVERSNLKSPPNFIKTFFKYQPDHDIEQLSKKLETVIEDLSNTRNRIILSELNQYPILITKAHTRPFEYKYLNIASAIIIPVGLFLYCRMWGFRLRLYRDLKTIKQTNENIIAETEKIATKQ
ncbi:MAG: YjgP/YjgQ family permease [Prevotella pallens]|jgi:permease, yjgP/yjgQ family|uniref:LptF/LptG family permease n=1 Tax=Prevotella pallens TaxID=60133 RepID=UPI001CAE3F0B|nr:LptF/LptG family permease [Prevotella pallens]MBF1458642.1 YjgP/YjgQ family permease [Prevotella pallens]MBF1469883.1 YjgP/YjgQ family permease [Prevotella pallens]MBF1485213.1 YjgP/YjgQ family permease [Prevotella pallens]MBF1489738.1 YjgP/YjgQ family permease [Prevotella pallens]MBF1492788.1 YjgP/YjgQ family permease [Prevotella pallens]